MKNPITDKKGSARDTRGGRWIYGPDGVRASARSGNYPTYRYYAVGFRIVRNA